MVKYLVFCVFVAAGYIVYTNFPVNHGPGITAKEEPNIERLTWQEPFSFKGATFTPKKLINAEVRIIKRKRYFFDSFSKYSPLDALVGWKDISDERNLDYMHFSLDDRKFDLEVTRPPLELTQIYHQSDLWHLVPSTSAIDEKIKKLRNGNIIQLKGMLVNISHDAGFDFTTASSLSAIAEEEGYTIWVEELEIR